MNQNQMLAHGPLCNTIIRNKIVLCESCAKELKDKIKNKLKKRILELKKENEEMKEKELD